MCCSKIYKNLDNGINNQFRNYVIQYLLITDDLEYNEIKGIVDKISENICSHYKKIFVNVIEKFFENSKEYTRNILLNNLIEKESHSINELLIHPFGNYIIKKALIIEKGELYIKILKITINRISDLKKLILEIN